MKHLLPALAVLLLLVTPAVGQDYEKGYNAAIRGDFTTALREFRPLAEQGDAKAQQNLGSMFQAGVGVPQDYAEALKWFRLAAEQGQAIAQMGLGFMYFKGQGVPQNIVTAHVWFNLAGAQVTADIAKGASEARDMVAEEMTSAQIAEAQKLAREWIEKHPK